MSFDFTTSLFIVLGLLIMALPGFFVVKLKVLNEDSIKVVSKIALYVSQPFLMIMLFQDNNFDKNVTINMLILIGILFVIYILFLLIAPIFLFYRKNDLMQKRTLSFAAVFGNVGYMGIPLIKGLIPNQPNALLYTAAMLLVFNFTAFIFGAYSITRDKKFINVKELFINPLLLGIYIGIILYFANIKLPEFLHNSFTSLGNMCIPLSMILLGMRFALADIKTIFKNSAIYVTSLVKLIIFPLIAYVILLPFNIDELIKFVIVISCAMPCSALALMFSETFKQDSYSASGAILVSTLLSLITIPCLLLILY